jgi:hypothetical protein
MGGVGISHTTVSVFYRCGISYYDSINFIGCICFTHTSHLCSILIIYYIIISLYGYNRKMLVNARSEFIWGIKFGNYRVCLFYYSIIYLYYQLFIHQNYTRSAHILKRGIFSFEVLIESSRLENRSVRNRTVRHATSFLYFLSKTQSSDTFSCFTFELFIYNVKKQAERLNRTVHRGQPRQ